MAQRLKCWPSMQETRVRSLDREDTLEKEMATHSSILAWRISWTEEPGRLQSTGRKELDTTSLSLSPTPVYLGFPCGSAGKESVCNAADLNSILGLGRCPGEGKDPHPSRRSAGGCDGARARPRGAAPRPRSGASEVRGRSREELPHAQGQEQWQGAAKFRLKLKKVEKTTRPFRYDLNQIAYDYTVEVRNRFKGLDLMDRVPDELWMEVNDIVQETGIKTIPKKKKCKKAKWLSEEALQIAVKRREAKRKDIPI